MKYSKIKIKLIELAPLDQSLSVVKISKQLNKLNTISSETCSINPVLDLSNDYLEDSFANKLASNFAIGQSGFDYFVFITSHELEGNWFVRRNDFCELTGQHQKVNSVFLFISTKDISDGIQDLPLSTERIIAGKILISIYTSEFLKRGANYYDIYCKVGSVENSLFNFCLIKSHLKNALQSQTIGYRVKDLMTSIGYTQKEIEIHEQDAKRITKNLFDSIEYWAKSNVVLFALANLGLGLFLGIFF